MNFTLIFGSSPEAELLDRSGQAVEPNVYSLKFEPCPIWRYGERWEVVPDGSNPRYAMGHLRHLLNRANFDADSADSNSVYVFCHFGGHGIPEDLELLEEDLKSEGFDPLILPE